MSDDEKLRPIREAFEGVRERIDYAISRLQSLEEFRCLRWRCAKVSTESRESIAGNIRGCRVVAIGMQKAVRPINNRTIRWDASDFVFGNRLDREPLDPATSKVAGQFAV